MESHLLEEYQREFEGKFETSIVKNLSLIEMKEISEVQTNICENIFLIFLKNEKQKDNYIQYMNKVENLLLDNIKKEKGNKTFDIVKFLSSNFENFYLPPSKLISFLNKIKSELTLEGLKREMELEKEVALLNQKSFFLENEVNDLQLKLKNQNTNKSKFLNNLIFEKPIFLKGDEESNDYHDTEETIENYPLVSDRKFYDDDDFENLHKENQKLKSKLKKQVFFNEESFKEKIKDIRKMYEQETEFFQSEIKKMRTGFKKEKNELIGNLKDKLAKERQLCQEQINEIDNDYIIKINTLQSEIKRYQAQAQEANDLKNTQIKKFLKEGKNMKNEIKDLESQIERFRTDNKILKDDKSAILEQNDSLVDKMKKIEECNNNLKSINSELQKENEQISKFFQESNQFIEQSKGEFHELEQQLLLKNKTILELKQKLTDLKIHNTEILRENKQIYENEIHNYRDKCKDLESELAQEQNKVYLLEQRQKKKEIRLKSEIGVLHNVFATRRATHFIKQNSSGNKSERKSLFLDSNSEIGKDFERPSSPRLTQTTTGSKISINPQDYHFKTGTLSVKENNKIESNIQKEKMRNWLQDSNLRKNESEIFNKESEYFSKRKKGGLNKIKFEGIELNKQQFLETSGELSSKINELKRIFAKERNTINAAQFDFDINPIKSFYGSPIKKKNPVRSTYGSPYKTDAQIYGLGNSGSMLYGSNKKIRANQNNYQLLQPQNI